VFFAAVNEYFEQVYLNFEHFSIHQEKLPQKNTGATVG